jgi:hypothetical protein
MLTASLVSNYALAATHNLWSNSPVGTCTRLSEESQQKPKNLDEDLDEATVAVVTESIRGKRGEKFIWIWDNTPSRNPTRSLLKESVNRTSCTILFLPIADQHNFKIDSKGNLPSTVKSTTSPITNSDGTTEVIEISYRLNHSTGFYSKTPSNCRKITGKKNLEMNCKTL